VHEARIFRQLLEDSCQAPPQTSEEICVWKVNAHDIELLDQIFKFLSLFQKSMKLFAFEVFLQWVLLFLTILAVGD